MIYISIYMTHALAKTINFHLYNIYIISDITSTSVFSPISLSFFHFISSTKDKDRYNIGNGIKTQLRDV